MPRVKRASKRREGSKLRPIQIKGVGEIHQSDALTFLRGQPSESASIVFLDPPFNLGKSYGRSASKRDGTPEQRYTLFLSEVLDEAVRILAPGGALYFYHLPRWGLRFGKRLARRLDFRHWIAVSMKNGFVRGDRLYPAHYALLYFTKGQPVRFRRPKVPVQLCRHCGKPIKDYGGYKEFVAKGINVSDIWDDFSPVRHRIRKHRTANELPIGLLNRVLQISGLPKGLLIDPFVGTGTSLVAAVAARMQFLAADREESACKVAAARVRKHVSQLKRARR